MHTSGIVLPFDACGFVSVLTTSIYVHKVEKPEPYDRRDENSTV